MTIDVDWGGTAANPYRILIPRADMPLVQASPEIRELDVNQFRKDLRTLEAATPGAPFPETHRHQTETTLSGTTFARQVEILAPYMVEFEDGQYSVRAVGANHNLLDVKVNNQVSLLVVLSAGLVNPDIGEAVLDASLSSHVQDGTIGDAISKLYALSGLDASKPLTVTPTRRFVGPDGSPDVDQEIATNAGVVTVTRQ